MKRWAVRLPAAAAVLCLLVATLPVPAEAAISPSAFESCLLAKINQQRVTAGRAPLEMAWDKIGPVRDWSRWMRYNDFRHMTSSERNPILPPSTTFWTENIAWTSNHAATDCTQVHNMFKSSPGHNSNRMSPNVRFAALGTYVDSSGWWVTELFFDAPSYPGAPPPEPCPPGKDCDANAYQEASGRFVVRQGLEIGAQQTSFFFGTPGDIAFSGDWDCDGDETLGLYRRSNGYAYLRNSNSQGVADISFYFGIPSDIPIAGDFDGDGCDTVSIYRPSQGRFYITNRLGANDRAFVADYSFLFGVPGDKPFVGDFNGDGVDTIGLHRESTGLMYFRNSNSSGYAHTQFVYGIPRDKVVAGDWDGDGDDTIAVYRPSTGMVYIRYSNTGGNAEAQLFAGDYNTMLAIDP
jgi:hypothetical protein